MDIQRTMNEVKYLIADIKKLYKRYFDRPKPVQTLEYVGELVDEFKWVDPLTFEHAITSSDFLPPDYEETKSIKFPLEPERRKLLTQVKVDAEFDFIMAKAYEMDGYSISMEEYNRVYNDKERIEYFIEHHVIPSMVSIRMDKTGAYDWLMIQMEEPSNNLCQMIYDLKSDGYGTPDRAKEKVFEFFRIFVDATEKIREKAEGRSKAITDAEVAIYTQTADFELKYLKTFVLQDEESKKDLYR
jgi:hypothetical protein